MKIKEKVLKELGKSKDGKTFGDRIANNIIDLTLAEVEKTIDIGIKDMEFMIKQGNYEVQAKNGLLVLKTLKKMFASERKGGAWPK